MKRATSLLLIAATVLVAACEAPTAARPTFAYNPTTLSNGQLYRWENGRKLNVWVDVADSSGAVDIGRSVRAAVQSWNAIPYFREFELVLVAQQSDAQILIYDRSRPIPITPGSCAFDPRAAVGYTYFCVDGKRAQRLALASGGASQASVVIRVDRTIATSQLAYDAIIAHEIGHALGIGAHSDVSTDVMFGLPTTVRPTFRDAQTLQYLLGTPADIIL